MKRTVLFFSLLLIACSGKTQDIGYRTTDAGGGFVYTDKGTSYQLQFAMNAKLYHSFVFGGGYQAMKPQTTATHTRETGKGWNAYLGYRYYFSYMPKRFFLGARAGIQSTRINWTDSEGTGNTNLLVLQPAMETGFTFVFDDQFYITPHVLAAYQQLIQKKGDDVAPLKSFLPGAGIAMGFRF